MKKLICMVLIASLMLTGCIFGAPEETTLPASRDPQNLTAQSSGQTPGEGETVISLSDSGVSVNGEAAPAQGDVYTAHDIVYYESGHDFTYGEGSEQDAHDADEAAAHTVVHIAAPGTYRISGTLSAGQIAVDLGEGAEDDPNAVVTLILDGADITCTVAPAVIFYNVYECGSAEEETASAVVDTSAAGANVVLAENSVSVVNGSYVARIYREGTVVLSEDGTAVEDAKKLHKYDAAFYSKMTMNVDGGGTLLIRAENEGLDSELHLTINGGEIYIRSGNDGINTNEDNVSVTTINGGLVSITVTGETGEGDGIDSNGWLVINGGTVLASACGFSGDAGIDSDLGIYINGGTVMASGNMLDAIAGGNAAYAVFQFSGSQSGGGTYVLKNEEGEQILEYTPENGFSCLILGGDAMEPGTYSLWMGETQLSGVSGNFFGNNPGTLPERFEGGPPQGDFEIPPQPTMPLEPQVGSNPSGQTPPHSDGQENPPELPQGEAPTVPEGITPPEGMTPGSRPMGPGGNGGFGQMPDTDEATVEFVIVQGGNYFIVVAP